MKETESSHSNEQAQKKPAVLWLKDLAARWDVSEVTLWRQRKNKKIPEPTVKIGKKVGWATDVIEAFEHGLSPSSSTTQDARLSRKSGAGQHATV